jgi:preprotein translocase subunit SecB
MSEEITNGAAAPVDAATGPAFTVEKIYVKDVSFESPNARPSSTTRCSRSCS